MFIYYIFRVYIHLGLNHGNSVLLDTKTYWVMRIVWCFILWVYLFFGHPLSSAGGRLTERICSQVVSVFRQILILSLSKVICWISSSVIFITALVMDKYPPLIIYWTTILIVPINAIAIPIVLSLTALKRKV